MKNDWPVEAKASGGRHYRNDYVDQNFDTYSVEYTFKDGSKLFLDGRTMPNCHSEFASYAHGTKGSAVISASGHSPAKCRIYSGQSMKKEFETWKCQAKEPSPYNLEWEHLIHAIRNDLPYNEVERGVKASVVTSMGRMAAHTGQVITYDDMLNCQHEFAPGLETSTARVLPRSSPTPTENTRSRNPESSLIANTKRSMIVSLKFRLDSIRVVLTRCSLRNALFLGISFGFVFRFLLNLD